MLHPHAPGGAVRLDVAWRYRSAQRHVPTYTRVTPAIDHRGLPGGLRPVCWGRQATVAHDSMLRQCALSWAERPMSPGSCEVQ